MSRYPSLVVLVLLSALIGLTPALASPPKGDATPAQPTDQVVHHHTGDQFAQASTMTRIERWHGSFNGCLEGATPEERAMAASIEYTCACLATYLVNLCAPLDTTPDEQLMMCFEHNEMMIQNVFTRCLTYGPLVVSP